MVKFYAPENKTPIAAPGQVSRPCRPQRIFLYYLPMWEEYHEIIRRYPKLSLEEDRRLIARAQAGSKKSRDTLVLGHIRFVMWRLRKKIFYRYLVRYGDDMLAGAIPVLYRTVDTYDLDYRDADNKPNPVRFSTYIRKWIDGFALAYIKKEIKVRCYDERTSRRNLFHSARRRLRCGKPANVL